MYIDYLNPIIRNHYGIKEQFVTFLENNKMSLFVSEDNVIVYDEYGNDIVHMTLKQLSRRVQAN